MKRYKRIGQLILVLGMLGMTASGITNVEAVNSAYYKAQTSIVNSEDEFIKAYNTGVTNEIINKSEMSQQTFIDLCKDSVYPAYLEAVKDDPTITFQQYIAEDNYEQPIEQPGDNPTTVSAEPSMNRTAAHNGYSMKAGDILVCYGTNSMGRYVGHAAIATSSKFVLEMPGTSISNYATHTSKSTFFKRNTKGSSYVLVYRIKKHPYYAKYAQDYAWHHMYKSVNPRYGISTNLYHKSPSYCSKYVYLAYRWGATKKSVKNYPSNFHIVTPHGLVGNFVGSFKPNYIHKITKY